MSLIPPNRFETLKAGFILSANPSLFLIRLRDLAICKIQNRLTWGAPYWQKIKKYKAPSGNVTTLTAKAHCATMFYNSGINAGVIIGSSERALARLLLLT